jgi:hypothetical protein
VEFVDEMMNECGRRRRFHDKNILENSQADFCQKLLFSNGIEMLKNNTLFRLFVVFAGVSKLQDKNLIVKEEEKKWCRFREQLRQLFQFARKFYFCFLFPFGVCDFFYIYY